MAKLAYLLLGLAVVSSANAAAADEGKPYGRVCLALFEPGPPEKEEPFKPSAPVGPGKQLRAHIDASNKCLVLMAALTKDGKLANGWRPQFADVPEEFEDIQLPTVPVSWDWTTASASFDVYVLFLAPGSIDAEEAKKLAAAMQGPKVEDRLLAMQTNKLRELIGRITSAKEKSNQAPMTEPEVGGVFRGAAFPWRQFAQSINFDADRPGVLILSSEGPGKNPPAP